MKISLKPKKLYKTLNKNFVRADFEVISFVFITIPFGHKDTDFTRAGVGIRAAGIGLDVNGPAGLGLNVCGPGRVA